MVSSLIARSSYQIDSFAAESQVRSALKSINAKPVQVSAKHWLSTALMTHVGNNRIKQAEPYLMSEYNGSWSNVPPSEVLDRVFGIDALISYRGWTIAIDITLDDRQTVDKANKQRQLSSLYSELGIDLAVVLVVPEDCSPEYLQTNIRQALSRVIAGESVVYL
ncbi:hypothetical protein K9N68_37335 (plasmid) [Kovacikia minuta CCNUW1]|uniref:hypothetical protein n=1 Tax=Kovacikia minuta TaxID=2931930 RepID=UPI001CCE3E61|nr:hypothetical protein [Kovacikia minuta]UBF29877.1 hypothetical protein K9N68_37335 [Kovacikia minuta CCNUW1]